MLALALASSAVALILSLLLQTLVPVRPVTTYTVSEIVTAVHKGAPWLHVHNVDTIAADADLSNQASQTVATRIAMLLHLPVADVTMDVSRIQGHRTVLLHSLKTRPELVVVGNFRLWLRQPDGHYLLYRSGPSGFLDDRLRRNLLLFLVSALVMLPVTWVVARWLTRPIKQFAHAADQLGRDPGRAPPTIRGYLEADRASAALTQMQQRIDSYVTERTRILAAIAHDLRTPLTRLAFRIEAVPPPLADAMTRDVEEMQQMLTATMLFARADALGGHREPIELGELVREVADDMALTSRGIVMKPSGEALPVSGDRLALRRLLANLIGNALLYGGNATIISYRSGNFAVVDVEDDGEGIPDEAVERLFEPFQRLETSRNRHTGGIGLGLPIARSTARAHGGDVVLRNRSTGGLCARLSLPLAEPVIS